MEENNLGLENMSAGEVAVSFEETAIQESGSMVKINRSGIWETVAKYSFLAISLLLPIFALPFTIFPLEMNKAYLVFLGTAVISILWLISFIQTGEIKVPKSSVLAMFVVLAAVYLVSAIFSDNRQLSLIGEGYNLDSFSAIALLSFLSILGAFLFQERKSAAFACYAVLASSFVMFAFQFFKVVFNVNLIPFNIFPAKTSNLFGTWNELGIFFGGIVILSMILMKFTERKKIFLGVSLTFSLVSLAVINFITAWMAVAGFSLVFLIYIFSNSKDTRSFAGLPLVVFIVSILFIFLNSVIGNVLSSTSLNYIEVRPSWSGTFDIVKSSLKADPFLGSGPGTFPYNWLLYKPQAINLTQFWGARFNSGIGLIPSFFATGGIIITLAWVLFFVFLLLQFFKILSVGGSDTKEKNSVAIAAFFTALYFWLFSIIYVPTFAIFALAFIFTGIFIAQLSKIKKIGVLNVNFLGDPKIKFVASLAVLVIIVASLGIFYVFSKKYIGSYYFAKGIEIFNTEGDVQKVENYILKSSALDPQDKYFRALTELGLVKMQQIINNTTASPDELRAKFQAVLSGTIKYAQTAVNLNKLDPLNSADLAKVYEAVTPLKVEGALNLALNNYLLASEHDPFNPDYLIARGRILIQDNKINDAKNVLNGAINLKPDYALPNFMLAQIEASSGNLEEAIKKTKDTYFLAPNDIGVLFQLGLLYYQNKDYDNARLVFERAVSLSPNYSNARYFLGLIYDKQNRRDDSIKEFQKIVALNPDNKEVKIILNNLSKGKPALDTIVPPGPSPEKRQNPPINQNKQIEGELKR